MTRTAWTWYLSIDTTTLALARLSEGLIKTGSKLLDSFVMGTAGGRLGRGISAFVLVEVPEKRRLEFAEIVKPYEMTRPIRVDADATTQQVEDGHPGESWSIRQGKVRNLNTGSET